MENLTNVGEVLFEKGTEFEDKKDKEAIYALYRDFKKGDKVAYVVEYGDYLSTGSYNPIEVYDLGEEDCFLQPYGNKFDKADKVVVTQSFSFGMHSFVEGDVSKVDVKYFDEEQVFKDVGVFSLDKFGEKSGGVFVIEGVKDFSDYFKILEDEEEVVEKEDKMFRVGDTVQIKNTSIFHSNVNLGDLAEVVRIVEDSTYAEYVIRMESGDHKGETQYAIYSYLELVTTEDEKEDKGDDVMLESRLGFTVGDTVEIVDTKSLNTKVSEGDLAKVVGFREEWFASIGDVCFVEIELISGELTGKRQITDDYQLKVVKYEVGDTVKIVDTEGLSGRVSVGDLAVITSMEEPCVQDRMLSVRIIEGDAKDMVQLVFENQVAFTTEGRADTEETVGRKFSEGDVVALSDTAEGIFAEGLATVQGVDSDGHYVLKFENGMIQYAVDSDLVLASEKEVELKPFEVGDKVRIKEDSIFHPDVSTGDVGVVDYVNDNLDYGLAELTFKVVEGSGKGKHQMIVKGVERHHRFLEILPEEKDVEDVHMSALSKMTDKEDEEGVNVEIKDDDKVLEKGDVVVVKDTKVFSTAVSVGDRAEVIGKTPWGSIELKMLDGEGEGLVQSCRSVFIELDEELTEFEVGDIVEIKDDVIFHPDVSVGDKAEVIRISEDEAYVVHMLDGDNKGHVQQATGLEKANRYYKLVEKASERLAQFEVGDIVEVKDDYLFHSDVSVGDLAEVLDEEYTILMISGGYKGETQVALGDEVASKHLTKTGLVRK